MVVMNNNIFILFFVILPCGLLCSSGGIVEGAIENYHDYCIVSFSNREKSLTLNDPLHENEKRIDKTVAEYIAMSPTLQAFSDAIPNDGRAKQMYSATIGYGPEGVVFPLVLCNGDYTDCACAAFVDNQLCNSCEICDDTLPGVMPVAVECSNIKEGACNMRCQNSQSIPFTCQYHDPMRCVGVDIPKPDDDDLFVSTDDASGGAGTSILDTAALIISLLVIAIAPLCLLGRL